MRLRRPSLRRNSGNDEIVLNLVPMMDALVTLIAFLLFTMSFFAFVSMDSPIPIAAKPQDQELRDKPLQLTLTVTEKDVQVWSPFDRFKARNIPYLPTGEIDLKTIHETLLVLKKEFPSETRVIFVPNGEVTYDQLVSLMDTVRLLEKTDPAIFTPTTTDQPPQQVKTLFPEIVFGNLLGGES